MVKKSKGLKKSGALVLTAMLTVLSMSTTTFATPLSYDAEEGIGIEVQSPTGMTGARSTTDDPAVSVAGGKLWTTWKGASMFRANYDHSKKTHRCSVTNDHKEIKRSEWVSKGARAISPWLYQTFSNNKAYAATK